MWGYVIDQLLSWRNGVVDVFVFFFKQKTAYEIYQCDWSSDVCSSDLGGSKIDGPALFDLPAFKRLGMDKVNPVDNMRIVKDMDLRIRELLKKICK